MDCDFSHDPAAIPSLLAALDEADVVLGSRYVPGGGVVGWPLLRQAISKGGCLYARLVLGVPVHDLTGGFKAFRSEVLEYLLGRSIDARGYGFQIQMTYEAILAGYRVREIPIVFRDRVRGASKMALSRRHRGGGDGAAPASRCAPALARLSARRRAGGASRSRRGSRARSHESPRTGSRAAEARTSPSPSRCAPLR